ncbi:MAG: methylmalonyl Co-A mutase-associated GTPase MeaB [Fidelibacterota bacterium]
MNSDLIDRLRSNDQRTLSRVISQIENNSDVNDEFFISIHEVSSSSLRIGVTGPPGAGKSTLVDQLIREYLAINKSVGVLAVDPTSPFTGGALLGDRVRMNHYEWNEDVFIRSMGSHGDLGGLARKAQEVGDVLAASGKEVIIFETVGVGQGEYEVAKAVDLTVVVLVPESGDEIQMMKAGLIEIADLFVINKSDREGAGRLGQLLKNALHSHTKPDLTEPPVFNTVATKQEGIKELFNGMQNLLDAMVSNDRLIQKKLDRYRNRVLNLVQERLLDEFWTREKRHQLEASIQALDSTRVAPHEVAQSLLNS